MFFARVVQQLQTQIVIQKALLKEPIASNKPLESLTVCLKKQKKNKLKKYDDKDFVTNWATHKGNWLHNALHNGTIPLTESCLTGAANPWWIVAGEFGDKRQIQTIEDQKKPLVSGFVTQKE